MGRSFLMAFDLGGGSGRCLLADTETGVTFSAKRNWSHPVAPGTAGLGYDLDLEDMWGKLGEASRQVMLAAGAEPDDVKGIAACSMRNTTVLLDADDEPLFATPNQDARALGNALMLAAERGMEVYEAGGHWPSPLFTGTRLLWLRDNAPDLLERAARVASLSDWVGLRLGGALLAERSQAGETLLYDQCANDWDLGLIESLGMNSDLFPETVDAGSLIGALTPQAAEHLGLAAGTPVAAGGADTQCGLLGMGCTGEGGVGISAGTSMPVQQVTGSYVLDGEGRLWSSRHALPGLYVVESNGMITGTVLEWFSRVLYQESCDPLAALFAEAALSEPGASGVYSTLGARVFDARTTSVLLGNITMSHMVTPDAPSCRAHMSRALLEGIAYSARANLEQVLAVTGLEPAGVSVGGGMAGSAIWTGIVADVLGRRVGVPPSPEVLVTEMDIVDFEALRELPGMKMIVCCRVNAVNVDLEAATAFGVPVANTPGRNADAVADLVVTFMVMLARKLPQAATFLKEGKVEAGDMARMGEAYLAYQGKELWRKTVGLVGLGSVGERVARRLVPFGARVLFYDPGVSAGEGAFAGAEKVSFEELLERSDFVSLHAPAMEATENMMDRAAFSRMKEGAFFVNTARPSLVDDEALAEALEAGRLAGAALDVFSVEPPGSDDRLAGRENVIATPHVGGNTEEIGAHQGEIAARQVRMLLRGGIPEHILNPEVLREFSWTGPRREPGPEELERLAANPKPSMTS